MGVNDIDSYLRENWGKKPRSVLRRDLGFTEGELIWHAGRLGLALTSASTRGVYMVHIDGALHIPKRIITPVGLEAGAIVKFEIVSNKPLEKIVKIVVEPKGDEGQFLQRIPQEEDAKK